MSVTRSGPDFASLALALAVLATSAWGEDRDRFFDLERYRLIRSEEGYRLRSTAGDLGVPLEWLEPPQVVREDQECSRP